MNKATRTAYAQNVRTVYDAGQHRRDEAAESAGRAIEAQNKLDRERRTLSLFPEVGILIRKGKPVYYAYIGGRTEAHYNETPNLDSLCHKIDPRRILPPKV